jgi:hypothetical protein
MRRTAAHCPGVALATFAASEVSEKPCSLVAEVVVDSPEAFASFVKAEVGQGSDAIRKARAWVDRARRA